MKYNLDIQHDAIINDEMVQRLEQNKNIINCLEDDKAVNVIVNTTEVPKHLKKIIIVTYLSDRSLTTPNCELIKVLGLSNNNPALEYIHKNKDLLNYFKDESREDIVLKYGPNLGMLILMDNHHSQEVQDVQLECMSVNSSMQLSTFSRSNFSTAVPIKDEELSAMINLLSGNSEIGCTAAIIAQTLVENLSQHHISLQNGDLPLIACMVYYRSNHSGYQKLRDQAQQKLSLDSDNIQQLLSFTDAISDDPDLLKPVGKSSIERKIVNDLVEKINSSVGILKDQGNSSGTVETLARLHDDLSKLYFDHNQNIFNIHFPQETSDFLVQNGFNEIYSIGESMTPNDY
ncbi:hypothetical protein [Rickettsia endosymbiont of Culicoides newsteadi]|uniref:hypothetical protein n=1 Tax=Rickettsia endosymbiont of Culicoides newsteadi TaxID=1961830 RepID=UPI000B9B398D|nr:hypothetical protein [Rickettsia endosymbiont of Culicoides newsteadi]OZG31268.1 hypothetical protein RiCNE_13460 [Rickettsia endosymbiont of Culicoides newsteadi]